MALKKSTLKWLKKNNIKNLENKTVLITGATSGVGLKMAEISLKLGARVILACRSKSKAEALKQSFLEEYKDAKVDIYLIDISSFESIDNFVNEIKEDNVDIDVFVNNAGVMNKPGQFTEDGFDAVIGTNYFGTYYLTKSILDHLRNLNHEVILVNTTSISILFDKIEYDNFYNQKSKKYSTIKVYSKSKLSMYLYTKKLAEDYKNTNLRIVMSHPGISLTPLAVSTAPKGIRWFVKLFIPLFLSPEKAALVIPYITNNINNIKDADIIGPSKMFYTNGYPGINKIRIKKEYDLNKLIEFTVNEIRR